MHVANCSFSSAKGRVFPLKSHQVIQIDFVFPFTQYFICTHLSHFELDQISVILSKDHRLPNRPLSSHVAYLSHFNQ